MVPTFWEIVWKRRGVIRIYLKIVAVVVVFYDVKLIFQEENFCQMLSNFRVEEPLKGPQLVKPLLHFFCIWQMVDSN